MRSNSARTRPDIKVGLSLIFGRSFPAPEQAVQEGLASYLNALSADTDGKYVVATSHADQVA